MRRLLIGAALVAAALAATACTSTVAVKPEYISAGYAAPVVKGRAVLLMSQAEREAVITAHPNSYTGAATQIAAPSGAIIAAVGEKVLGAAMSEGVLVQPAAATGAYTFHVSTQEFSFKYDQLSSLGFAVTPKVTVRLGATVTDPQGRKLIDGKPFEARDFSATGAYLATLHPQEKINQSFHQAVADLFRRIVDETAVASRSPDPAPAAAPTT